MFKKYFTVPSEFEKSSSENSSYQFIISFSSVILITLIYFIFFNLFTTKFYSLAFVELLTFFALYHLIKDLRQHHDIEKSSTYFVYIITILILCVDYAAHIELYALIWNFFVPLLAFYLLGNKKGVKIVFLFSLILFAYIFYLTPDPIPMRASENFIISYVLFSLAMYSYEKTRSNSYLKIQALLTREHQNALVLEELSITDPLTKIYNRIKLDNFLEQTYQRARRYGEEFSIIIIDIDHFKEVNDLYGHLAGDQILIEFTQLIGSKIRKSDIFGRWGGEEFMLILPNTSCRMATQTAEHLRKLVESHPFSYAFSNTASFGISAYEDEESILELVNNADRALYQSKKDGRNRITKKMSK